MVAATRKIYRLGAAVDYRTCRRSRACYSTASGRVSGQRSLCEGPVQPLVSTAPKRTGSAGATSSS